MGENREAAGNFCPAAGQRGEEYVALYKGPELLPVAYYAGGAYLAAKPGDLRGELRRQRDDRLSGGRRHFRGVCGGQLQTVLQMFVGGIEGAILILAAQYWGKKDTQSIRKVVSIGVKFALGVGIHL